MTTMLIIVGALFLYVAGIGLVLRFITFLHRCDDEMHAMVTRKKRRSSVYSFN